jgi:myosin-light-chain kinase
MNAAQALGHKWLKTAEQQKALSKTKLKRYVIKKQWIRATNTILALRRMGAKFE